jgi:hypothetical protein
MSRTVQGLAAIVAAVVLTFVMAPSPQAADLDTPRSSKAAPTAKVVVERAGRVGRHRGPGWIWVRRAHKDHYKYVYREFGSYFARGRATCWC